MGRTLRSVLPSSSRARALTVTSLGVASFAATLGVPVAHAAPAAPAAPLELQATGPFSANGTSSLLRVDVPALAGTTTALLPQTNVDLARSSADADSDGDLDGAQADPQRTAAAAGTTGDTSLLGQPVALQSAFASAPESEVDDPDPIVPIPLPPLLDLGLIDTAALANWISDTECVASSDPLSAADQDLADATVLEVPDVGSVVDVLPGPDGAADTEASTGLPATGGADDARAVQARAATILAGASVLNGLAGPDPLVDVDVVQSPDYTATATGLPGGATVTGDDPVVNVSIAGGAIVVLEANDVEEVTLTGLLLSDIVGGDLDDTVSDLLGDLSLQDLTALLAQLGVLDILDVSDLLADLQPVVRLSIPVSITEAADGTLARVDASLLRVEVLPPDVAGLTQPLADVLSQVLDALGLDIDEPLATVELAPVHAEAIAPAGGITCGDDSNPLEVNKVNSGPAVPGSSFDYTIAVGNVGECAMDPVRVTDTVVGPVGTTIGITEPAGATVTDLGNGDWRIDWANVGPIAPDGRTTLRVRVNVGANAPVGERFTDTVTGTASIVGGPGCTPREVTRTKVLPEPEVVGRPSGPCNITGSTKGKSHIQVYPGESFVYYVNVLNGGGEPCTNVTVVDPIDSRLIFESCSDGCTFTAPNASWNIGTLAPGQSVTLRLQVKVNPSNPASGTLANTATIDTNETPPHTVSVTGPNITTNSEESPGDPARIPNRDLARTGGSSTLPAPVLLALGLLALGSWNLRRRSIA